MKSNLSANHYWDLSIYDREMTKIFGSVWLFAGLKAELAKDNAYFLKKWGSTEVIFYKSKDQITALENTCPHRMNSIFNDPEGVKPLVCRYHGWSFESDGRLRKIPFEQELYQLSKCEKEKACLKSFAVKIVGEFIFVSLHKNPFPIERQFSPTILQGLMDFSESMDTRFTKTVYVRNFNWKLAYENLRDFNHLTFVHGKTLNTWTNFIKPDLSKSSLNDFAVLRALSFGGPEADLVFETEPAWYKKVQRWNRENKYYNYLLYPNLHLVTSSGGHSFNIEYHHPINATQTKVTIYTMLAKNSESSESIQELHNQFIKDSEVILNEDFEIMEQVQAQVAGKNSYAMLGIYEHMNKKVETWYLQKMYPWRIVRPRNLFKFAMQFFGSILKYVKKYGVSGLIRRISGGSN
jgi:phenylpropionate dioxygenase-like ring-hydroxylating dioxygenase large terminal subunit